MARSEKGAWRKVLEFASAVRDGTLTATMQHHQADVVATLAADMLDQLANMVHTNPALAIWANPPGGVRRNPLPATSVRAEEKLSPRVYEIGYKHEEDGQKYKHDFAPGVEMWLVKMGGRQAVVIFGTHGQDVYGDF